jgi:mannose-6-phosphate isomerase
MSEAPETMVRITGSPRRYDWGSLDRLPDFLGAEPDGRPLAEVWFGVHPEGPASLASGDDVDDRRTLLSDHIVSDPMRTLGPDVVGRYGEQLPYLLKLIAPDRALSLQVHPDLDRARDGYLAEEAAGIPRGAFERNYPDSNHKPELVYALETFEAVCGFRAPRGRPRTRWPPSPRPARAGWSPAGRPPRASTASSASWRTSTRETRGSSSCCCSTR